MWVGGVEEVWGRVWVGGLREWVRVNDVLIFFCKDFYRVEGLKE